MTTRRDALRRLAGTVMVFAVPGCATRIPGGDRSYTITAYYDEKLRAINARYDYGPFKDQNLGVNSGISSFTEYHVLAIHWNRPDGTRATHEIAIEPLIEALKKREENWFPTGWSEIQMRFEEPVLKISLKLVSHDYPIRRDFYPLYEFEMR